MATEPATLSNVEIHTLTPSRWSDLEKLFGKNGAYGGCWCMWWRLKRADWQKQKGEGNREAFKALVNEGEPTGLLAYVEGEPAGWCAIAPREAYPVMQRSPTIKRVDDKPVWSISCFYIARRYRRQGLTTRLIRAAVEYAREQGATIVEGYPAEPGEKEMVDAFVWYGFASAFSKAGFEEVKRWSPKRPIMRYYLESQAE